MATKPSVPGLDLNNPKHVLAAWDLLKQQSWKAGNLSYLFHETQHRINDAIQASKRRKFYLLCSRRLGKSFMLFALAVGKCLAKPNARVLFLAPTAKHAADIATDTALQVLQDCPTELKPEYFSQPKEFRFRNGSLLRLRGVNNEHAGDLRGGAADLVILDECGLMDNLDSVVSGVVLPMLMTTNGKVILATTPPESPGHDSVHIFMDLLKDECAVKFTLRDAPHIPDEVKKEYLLEAGEKREELDNILSGKSFPETTTALREFWCEFTTDANKAVVPEFTLLAQSEVVKSWNRPEYYHCYTAMDPGFSDKTGILFAYWDFLAGKLVIEDEALLHRANTNTIAAAIRAGESTNFPNQEPLRVMDVDPRLLADLRAYKLNFTQAKNKDPTSEVNQLRVDIQNRSLIINPRCKNLIAQIRNATWNSKATDFARAGEKSMDGHYDLLAALRYLSRFVQRNKNPYPEHYYVKGGKFGIKQDQQYSRRQVTSSREKKLGLFSDDPIGRKLAGIE